MIRAILVDDEPPARSILKSYLSKIGGLEIVAEYDNGFDAIKGVGQLRPDLLFLDVQLPKLNGFEVLELIDNPPFVIFTTDYDQYAVKAFEQHAVDYLLKPFSMERLIEAIERVRNLVKQPENTPNLKEFLKSQSARSDVLERIAIKSGTRIRIIYLDEIDYIESQDDYVMIYTREGKFLKQNTMKYFEEHLPPNSFVRVHRSYIVRVDKVAHIDLYEKDLSAQTQRRQAGTCE